MASQQTVKLTDQVATSSHAVWVDPLSPPHAPLDLFGSVFVWERTVGNALIGTLDGLLLGHWSCRPFALRVVSDTSNHIRSPGSPSSAVNTRDAAHVCGDPATTRDLTVREKLEMSFSCVLACVRGLSRACPLAALMQAVAVRWLTRCDLTGKHRAAMAAAQIWKDLQDV